MLARRSPGDAEPRLPSLYGFLKDGVGERNVTYKRWVKKENPIGVEAFSRLNI